jgi:hypothetical protein
MKTKVFITILSLGLVLVATLLAAVEATSAKVEVPRKITGGVQFGPVFDLDKGWVRFNVHETNPDTNTATGWVRWKEYKADEGWRRVSADATCVTFGEDEQTALVAVQIVDKSGWGLGEPGQWMVFWVHDGGTPGREGDEFDSPLWPPADEFPGCDYFTPEFKIPVTGGNLVIHH